MDTQITKSPKLRHKSPNAPAYNLQECQDDARRIFRAEGQAPLSRESIADHLALAPQSGPFNRKLSSLRQYGLLDPTGKEFRISELFLRIDQTFDEQERRRALRESLARPAVFQALLAHYENSGLPSEINLTNQLLLKYRFTKKNAETVSRSFLESCRLAGLMQGRSSFANYPPPTLPPPPSPLELATPFLEPKPPSFAMSERAPSLCRQEIPLGIGRRAILELPEDLTSEEASKLIRILQAFAHPL
ncbi:MAG: winged helix-turn-helix domain-containing protein [Deltaproteobacteria bacterium]|nr:winged helix-turn-helix domain-containing protein [Deltaproteobacteria bacterium]